MSEPYIVVAYRITPYDTFKADFFPNNVEGAIAAAKRFTILTDRRVNEVRRMTAKMDCRWGPEDVPGIVEPKEAEE